jgi:predicted amidophosphoribosyltransferase
MIQHGFPPRVPCPACGAAVPQRRDACAACRKPFPAPTLKGTEVFA